MEHLWWVAYSFPRTGVVAPASRIDGGGESTGARRPHRRRATRHSGSDCSQKIDMPASPSGDVEFTVEDGPTITVDPPDDGGGTTGVTSGDGEILYANTEDDTDLLLKDADLGFLESFSVVRDVSATHTFEYEIGAPSGYSLDVNEDGVAAVLDESDVPIMLIDGVATVDANGSEVPTEVSVADSTLIVTVDPDPSTIYPIVVHREFGYTQNPAEILFCAHPTHWRICLKAKRDAEIAEATAKARYPQNSLQDGRGDAFRHCYWNVRMVQSVGAEHAYGFATRHEWGKSGLSKDMDLRNNKIGRYVGVMVEPYFDSNYIGMLTCERKSHHSGLWIIVNEQIVLST